MGRNGKLEEGGDRKKREYREGEKMLKMYVVTLD